MIARAPSAESDALTGRYQAHGREGVATTRPDEPGAEAAAMRERVTATCRTLIAVPLVTVSIAIAMPIALVFALVFRQLRLPFFLAHVVVALALWLVGIRYRVSGRSRIPQRSVVFCSNHQSNVDGPVLFRALHPRLRFVYKQQLRQVPLLGLIFDVGGFVAVDRRRREQAIAALADAAASVRSGNSFLIFPEGTRSPDGSCLPFKKGGFIVAIQAQAPIVPVAVLGGRRAMRKGSAVIHPTHVTIHIGEPIATDGMTIDDRDRLLGRVRSEMQALIDRGELRY